MSPLYIQDNCANFTLTIRNTAGGLSARNTISLGCAIDGSMNQGDVDRISNIFRDNLKTLYDSQWELGPTHVLHRFGGDLYSWDDSTAEAGTHAADTYSPPQCATIVSKLSLFAGRRYRGRFYLPGVPDGYAGEDGVINPTWVSTVQTAVDALKTALLADAAVLVLVLFHTPGVDPTPDATVLDHFTVRTVMGTQRPRLRR